nr:MAG TPA: ECSIT protein-like protein [Caudoviricetes sp.]
MYASIDEKTDNTILAMIFLKEDTSEVYKKWCNYELN